MSASWISRPGTPGVLEKAHGSAGNGFASERLVQKSSIWALFVGKRHAYNYEWVLALSHPLPVPQKPQNRGKFENQTDYLDFRPL